jgi:hypothetical protein
MENRTETATVTYKFTPQNQEYTGSKCIATAHASRHLFQAFSSRENFITKIHIAPLRATVNTRPLNSRLSVQSSQWKGRCKINRKKRRIINRKRLSQQQSKMPQ